MNLTIAPLAVIAAAFFLLCPVAMPAASAQSCTGDACYQIKLLPLNACVWAESSSTSPVTLTALVEGTTVTLPLEAADLAKSQPAGQNISPQEARQRRECVNVLKSAKMLEDMRAKGSNVPITEIDGKAGFCRKLLEGPDQKLATATAAPPGVHTRTYDALFQRDVPRYRAQLRRGSSCVANLSDISSYTAGYATPAQKPAGQ